MAIALIIEVPGGTAEQAEQVLDLLRLDQNPAPGRIVHVAGPSDGVWRVLDVWESQEHFDRFLEERLGAALQEAGLAQPNVTSFPVHTVLYRDRAIEDAGP